MLWSILNILGIQKCYDRTFADVFPVLTANLSVIKNQLKKSVILNFNPLCEILR